MDDTAYVRSPGRGRIRFYIPILVRGGNVTDTFLKDTGIGEKWKKKEKSDSRDTAQLAAFASAAFNPRQRARAVQTVKKQTKSPILCGPAHLVVANPTDKQILTPFLEVSCSTCWSFFTWPHQEFKKHMNSRYTFFSRIAHYRFVWLISHYPTVLFFLNKPATSNQATILFSENKSALATYKGLSTRQIWIFSKSQLACCCWRERHLLLNAQSRKIPGKSRENNASTKI
jgi:hypothetical protein